MFSFLLKKLNLIIILIISFYSALLLTQKTNLTNSDLGRHLKNGQLILQHRFYLLGHNTYSYTYPNFPVVNHHWGSGLIFYLIYHLSGFKGLHLFYILLVSGAVFLVFSLTKKLTKIRISFWLLTAILSLPLITWRFEIRPEGFSFLFLAIFVYSLTLFLKGKISYKRLLLISLPIQFIWVNLHLFFIFGPTLIVLAWFSNLISGKDKDKNHQLAWLLILSGLVTIFNPAFIKGSLEPFLIFRNYGYMVAENQSFFFFLHRLPSFKLYLFIFDLVLALILISFWLKLQLKENYSFFLGISFISLSFLALVHLRALPLAGLVFIPCFYYFFTKTIDKLKIPLSYLEMSIFSLIVLIFWLNLFLATPYSPWYLNRFGLGLLPHSSQSAEFYLKNNLKGPIFNNYDIGSYLIWYLYPQEKVFVDNRPEAYPASFFQKVYVPAQKDENNWLKLDRKYHFNVIFFYRHDATPWGQPFLIRRLKDPLWSPIYVDDFSLILIRNSSKNTSLIKKFKLPLQLFAIK